MTPKYPSIAKLFGIELEFFTMDKEGNIVNEADSILNSLKSKLYNSNITNECGQHMVEMVSFPHRSSREVFLMFLKDLESLYYEADVNDLVLFNYGTYPGVNKGKTRTETRYKANEKIRGKGMNIANSCLGFHYHHSLPRNSFNRNILFLYPDLNGTKKKKVLNLFNLFVALDPAISTFMQSSPYYNGTYLGKSARTIVYRSEELFGRDEKLYKNYPDFSTLNEYAEDYKVLIDRIKTRAKLWKQLLAEKEVGYKEYSKKDRKASMLDSSWKPVKISSHGTIESRGADMNSLRNIVAMSITMKSLSKFIVRENIEIVPGEKGSSQPFKLEKKQLHVPQYKDLKYKLQKNSAIHGLENEEVLNYCRAMLELVKKVSPIDARAPLRIFSKMLSEKKTVSDEIVEFAKKLQGEKNYKELEPENAKQIALHFAEKAFKDLLITKKMAEQNLIFV